VSGAKEMLERERRVRLLYFERKAGRWEEKMAMMNWWSGSGDVHVKRFGLDFHEVSRAVQSNCYAWREVT
jgi:hypothetical protein